MDIRSLAFSNRRMARLAVVILLIGFAPAIGQLPPSVRPGAEQPAGDGLRLTFRDSPIELVLQEYSDQTGRTLLPAPNLPAANITLQSQEPLSRDEYLEAIETVLSMNGIALLPEGESFIRVVPNKIARTEPMPILSFDPEDEREDRSKIISVMIPLIHLDAAEAMKAIQPLKHDYGQINVFEGINKLLITDAAATVNRIVQVIGMIDQPIEAREEPIIVQIRYAKASEIKQKLEQIIAETQKEEKSTVPRQSTSGPPGAVARATPPGVIRARRTTEAETVADIVAEAERGIIRGEVKIVEDDRTNILILITRPENMSFFEKIIEVLDVETGPDVLVRVFRLEFAESKDIATMLNDLIGATQKEEGRPASGTPTPEAVDGGSAVLREFVQRREASTPETPGKSKVGELSKDNIKILSDERTNSLIIMASKGDIAALEEIIKDMDMMLSQVLIETVILEVNLDDNIQTGVDWVQRALVSYDEGPNGEKRAKTAYAGGGGGGTASPLNPLNLTSTESLGGATGAGLSYYFTFFDLNLDLVIKAVATDSRTRILLSPVILTTDNTEATIEVTQDQYFFKGQRPVTAGNSVEYVEDVERQKVGIKLSVTPRINDKRFVVMEIEQTIEDVAGSQRIEDTDWPIVAQRKFDAEVAVRSGETVVLGGLVKTTDTASKSGIPLLADIPILGIPFRASSKRKQRQEVIVFITPYVVDTPAEMMADAARRQESMNVGDMWERGWSDSRLANPRRLDEADSIPVPDPESRMAPARDAPAVDIDTGAPGGEADGAPELMDTPAGAPSASAMPMRIEPRDGRREPGSALMARREGMLNRIMRKDAAVPGAEMTPAAPAAGPDGVAEVEAMPLTVEAALDAPLEDPLEALDPELREYVEREDLRWSEALDEVDQQMAAPAPGR